MEMSDVTIEGLYPSSMDGISVAQFLEEISSLDEYFAGQVKSASKEGKVLRFAATVEAGQCRVGPTVVAVESPLGRLSGTDNLVELTTRWYNPNPLGCRGTWCRCGCHGQRRIGGCDGIGIYANDRRDLYLEITNQSPISIS